MKLRPIFRVVVLGALAACGSGAFEASSKVTSVRILATAVDQPYATPGTTVTLTTLAADGRIDPPTPMTLYWLPISCSDPQGDAYYACFAALAGRQAAGGTGGGTGGPVLKPGVDLTPFLPQGNTFSVKVPTDVITTHKAVPGSVAPFGTVFAFNIACAGHVEILPFDPGNINPQAPPIGCFDASHTQLGPDDYVIGFTEVFAYESITNANPVITNATLQGAAVDPVLGITFDHCGGSTGVECLENDIDVVVPESSWEVNPGDIDPATNTPHHEVLWVDYYATGGDFGSTAKLLYDAVAGKLPDPHVTYTAPDYAGEQTMWIVVHDNRGGVSWLVVPLHVR
jgi:hypothetical protein